jgi:beta-galactosidase
VTAYGEGPLTGQPAVTRYDVAGTSRWYVSTSLDRIALGALVGAAIDSAGVRPVLAGLPHGVDATRRAGGAGSWVFLVNTTEAALDVAVDGYDLVADRAVTGSLRLGAGATAVIREG